MANQILTTFFIDIRPTLNKDLEKKVEKYFNNLTKKQQDFNKEQNKSVDLISKMKKMLNNVSNAMPSLMNGLNSLSLKTNLLVGAFTGLSNLRFSAIEDLVDDINVIGDDSKEIYKYLSAAGRVLGTSTRGVTEELSSLTKAKIKRQIRPEWASFGLEVSQSVDEMLLQFRKHIRTLDDYRAKFFSERMGFSELYRIARLSDEEFNKVTKLAFFNRQNIAKLKEVSKLTKEVYGKARDIKDTVIVDFAPLVNNALENISNVLSSPGFKKIASSVDGLAEDLYDFNKTLKGLPLGALMAAMLLTSKTIRKFTFAGLAITGAQEIYNAGKAYFFPNKKRKGSFIEDYVNNHRKYDPFIIPSGLVNDNNRKEINQSNDIVININTKDVNELIDNNKISDLLSDQLLKALKRVKNQSAF